MNKPKAPRMVKLFVEYSIRSKEDFICDGLTGSIVFGKTNVPGESYDHPVVKILDGDMVVLEIHKENEYAPRTKAYVEGYSDRLDGYMDALEYAVSDLKTANSDRIDEDNRRRRELRAYENNLF